MTDTYKVMIHACGSDFCVYNGMSLADALTHATYVTTDLSHNLFIPIKNETNLPESVNPRFIERVYIDYDTENSDSGSEDDGEGESVCIEGDEGEMYL